MTAPGADINAADTSRVDRTALLQRVLASRARLITIVAPAGYGKSRFARSFMGASADLHIADCSEMLNVSTTVRVILRALGPFPKQFEDRLARLTLALPRDGSADDHWRELLDQALEHADATAVLCVENGEYLVERPDAAELVDRAVSRIQCRTIICSRVPLRLTFVSRIPPNDSYAVAADDLRFTHDEVLALFAPLSIEGYLLERVIQLARGWPIAVLTFVRAAKEQQLEKAVDTLSDNSGSQVLREYTLTQGLGSLSDPARDVLAAIAVLGRSTDGELGDFTDAPSAVSVELDTCPFVMRVGDSLEVHPLAVAALAADRAAGQRILLRAAALTQNPIRAAQYFLAAGEADRAADVLDTSVAPFMMEQPTPEVAALVASLDESVLLRHPTTWNATWMNRGYTVPSQRMLFESRTVWAALTAETSLAVRFGVGLSLINWLFFLGHADEAETVLEQLEGVTDDQPPDSMMRLLIAAHRDLALLRQGKKTHWAALEPQWDATAGAIPMVGAMAQYVLKGPLAFLNGQLGNARRAFRLGVDLGAMANSETVHVIAIKNAAFFAWLTGKTEVFAAFVDELQRATAPNVSEATRHFLGCATGPTPSRTPTGYELPVYRAYAWFIAAARESTPEGRREALRSARDAAVQDGQPWLIALAWMALGLADPRVRQRAFDLAQHVVATVEYPAFCHALTQAMQGAIPAALAGLRELTSDEPTMLEPIVIGLVSREIHLASRTLVLAPREAELLLALALHNVPQDRSTLAAMIWSDVAERNASIVGVYIARLRHRLGDVDLIESRGSGYALRRPVTVDLLLLEEAIQRRSALRPLAPQLEGIVSSRHVRLPQWVLRSSWLGPYAIRFEDAVRQIRTERAIDAKNRNDDAVENHYRRLLLAEDG